MDQKNRQAPTSGGECLRILRDKARDGTLGQVVGDWKWILSLSRRHWAGIVLYTLLGMAGSGVSLVSAVISKYLIDSVISLDRQRLLPLAAAMVVMSAVAVAARSLHARWAARLNVTMHNDIRARVFDSLLHSRWMEIRKFSTGDLLNRFSSDVSTLAGCAVTWLPNVVIQLFTLLATLAVVLYYDPVMALIAFASTPALFLASRHLVRRQRGYNQRLRQVSSDISAFQSETFRNVDTLKSFGVETDMVDRLALWQESYRDVSLEYNRFSIQTSIWLTALGNAVQYLAMAYCLWRLWRGDILFGTMVLFLQQRGQLSSAFSALVGQIPTALSGSVAAERVRELMELEKEPESGEICAVTGACSLELRNVWAAYREDRQVLRDVNLLAEPGQVVALMGPSGEGKSTLMRLILGLLPPKSGELFLTDGEGRRYDLGAATRQLFAYVPQGNTMLEGTVAENLKLVNPRITREEMVAALEDACAWEFVREMPGGLDAPIGEGGKGLSEGQAQRVAIARALARRAPVMLLDEATSALDRETERRVLENLSRRGVTTITATHRTSVLSLCSRVYRIHDGGIDCLNRQEIENILGKL